MKIAPGLTLPDSVIRKTAPPGFHWALRLGTWVLRRTAYPARDTATPLQLDQRTELANLAQSLNLIQAADRAWCEQLAYGTQLTWRDVMSRAMTGRLIEIQGVLPPMEYPDLDLIGTIPGSLIFRDSGNWIILPPGADTMVLTMSSGMPLWRPREAGPKGDKGDAGAPGADGAPGRDGTAGLIASVGRSIGTSTAAARSSGASDGHSAGTSTAAATAAGGTSSDGSSVGTSTAAAITTTPAFIALAHTIAQGTTTSVTTPAIDTTGAGIIIISACLLAGNTATPTDSKGNTWHVVTYHGQAGGAEAVFYWTKPLSVGPGHTFTLATGGATFPAIAVAAFSGGNSTPLDVDNGATASGGGTLQTGSITPTGANELIVYCLGDAWTGTVSVNIGSILDQRPLVGGTSFALAMAYEIQTTATTRNPTWTMNARAEAAIAAFKL